MSAVVVLPRTGVKFGGSVHCSCLTSNCFKKSVRFERSISSAPPPDRVSVDFMDANLKMESLLRKPKQNICLRVYINEPETGSIQPRQPQNRSILHWMNAVEKQGKTQKCCNAQAQPHGRLGGLGGVNRATSRTVFLPRAQ